jgi:hypothetical protein
VIIDGGPEAIHLDDPGPIMSRLMNFNPETRQAVPSLQTLSRAMEITLDPLDRPGIHRAVLFITPPLEVETVTGLQSLAAQARQGGVRIFIWQIAALDALDTPTVQQMQTMANETGGQFLNFSGVEGLPNIETYLEPLRHTCQLTYTSKAAAAEPIRSGSHQKRRVRVQNRSLSSSRSTCNSQTRCSWPYRLTLGAMP